MRKFRYSYSKLVDFLLLIYILPLLFVTILLIFKNNLLWIMTIVLNTFPILVYLIRKYTGLYIYKDKLIVNVGIFWKKIINIYDISDIKIVQIKNEKIKKKGIFYRMGRLIQYISMEFRIDCPCNTFHNGKNYEIKIVLKDRTNYVVPYYWMYKERNEDIVLKKRQELEEFIKTVMKKNIPNRN